MEQSEEHVPIISSWVPVPAGPGDGPPGAAGGSTWARVPACRGGPPVPAARRTRRPHPATEHA